MSNKLNAATLAIVIASLTACSHKDNSNTSATATSPSASAIMATNPADWAVDHKGNLVASAPASSTQPVNQPAVTDAAPDQLPPFVGTKEFNFDGGAQTVQKITIQDNGFTTLKEIHSNFGESPHFVTSFKGKFTNPIQLKDSTALLFKDGKVFRMINGKMDSSCSDVQADKDNVSCVSELDNAE